MEIEADVKLDARSLNRFLIYHNYMRVSGIIGLVLSLAAIVADMDNYPEMPSCGAGAAFYCIAAPDAGQQGQKTACHGGVPDPIPLLLS